MGDTRQLRRYRGNAHVRSRRSASLPYSQRYRVAAISSGAHDPPDLIVADGRGNTYLMDAASRDLTPLDQSRRDALGLFYEPTLDLAWHTLAELRRRYHDA